MLAGREVAAIEGRSSAMTTFEKVFTISCRQCEASIGEVCRTSQPASGISTCFYRWWDAMRLDHDPGDEDRS